MVINEAMAKYNSTLVQNEAAMESYLQVTKIEAESYGIMKKNLTMTNDDDFLKYMRVKTINQFNQKNLLIGIAPSVDINTPGNGNSNIHTPTPNAPPTPKPDAPNTPNVNPPKPAPAGGA